MRYLSSISLALIVLMALACSSEPAATPTPAESKPLGAFSCQELADTLAAAQTETAARVLTDSWNESGCAHRVAGVTKTPIPSPTPTPTIGPTSPPLPTSTPTPDYKAEFEKHFANAQLAKVRYPSIDYDRLAGVLSSYENSPDGYDHRGCINHAAFHIRQKNFDLTQIAYSAKSDTWTITTTGSFCEGIERYRVEDDTGKVTYLGSSLD